MTEYYVFNGDADGICALQQLMLAERRPGVLVTGVKRDIALLPRVDASSGDRVTALDISFDKNRDAALALLEKGVQVRYFDHHYAGELSERPGLDAHIDTTADRGTSLIVDDYLEGAHRAWAVVGTFGDNFDDSARRAAEPLGLADADLDRLRELGITLNYNSYGETVEDLHVAPATLYERLAPYANPLEFIERDPTFAALQQGYNDDMARVRSIAPAIETARHALYVLPAEAWARRASGVFANELAQAAPECAHALLTGRPAGGYVVSVRAPVSNPAGADELCRQFPTGGGRKAAAGINDLPNESYDRFVELFGAAYS